MITFDKVSYYRGERPIIHPASFQLTHPKITVIIGPNGAGKSTLLSLMAGDLPPTKGKIHLNQRLLNHYGLAELAHQRAVLQQNYHVPFSILSRTLFLMGQAPFGSLQDQSHNIHHQLIEALALAPLLQRPYQQLSGGEQHRLQIGRVLLQLMHPLNQAPQKLLLLDEPFNHLDLQYQERCIDLFRQLPKQGISIVAVVHELRHALALADELLLLDQGALLSTLTPQSPQLNAALSQLYQLDFHHLTHPHLTYPLYIPSLKTPLYYS